MVSDQTPRFVFGGVGRSAGIVRIKSCFKIVSGTGIELLGVVDRLDLVDVVHGWSGGKTNTRAEGLPGPPSRFALWRTAFAKAIACQP